MEDRLPSEEQGPTKCLVRYSLADIKCPSWASAMYEFLKVFYHNSYRNIKRVIINLDYVRPQGERLKTFGGRASGPEPLAKMFKKVYEVLTSDKFSPKPVNGKLRPIHLLDICNIIAEGIVVGGVN